MRRIDAGSERGAMLVEMLVVIVLMGVVGSVVTSGLVLGMRTTMRGQSRAYALAELQKAVDRTGRELRSGTPVNAVGALTDTSASVDVIRNGARIRFTYTLTPVATCTTNCVLQQTRTQWNNATSNPATTPPNSSTTTPLLTGLVNAPVFTYLDRNGLGAALTPPYATVDRVGISLQRSLTGAPPLRLESAVELRNTHLIP